MITNLVRQLVKPIPMKIEDDHHTHIATPKSFVSVNKYLLRGNASLTTGVSSMILFRVFLIEIMLFFV